MRSPWKHALHGLTFPQVVSQLAEAVRRDGPFDLAAQLAYWSLLAVFPFAIVLLTIIAYVPLHGLDKQLLDFVHEMMPREASLLFDSVLQEVVGKQHGGLLAVSLVGAVWTAAGGVSAAITALNKASEVEEKRPYWKTKLIALGTTLAGTILLIVALSALLIGPQIGHAIWSWFGLGELFDLGWRLLRWPIVVVAMMSMLAVVYWLLPDVHNRFRFITPGAILATILWIGSSLLFGLYASHFGAYSKVYGTLGGAVVLLTWLYLSGLVVILGGLLNAILDRAAEKDLKLEEQAQKTKGARSTPPAATPQPA